MLLQQNDKGYKKPLYLALIAAKNGEFDEAEEYIEQAIELDAKSAEVQFTYAKIMAEQAEASSIFSLTGYIKKVKKAFIVAVELAPENIEYRRALIHVHGKMGDTEKFDEELKMAMLNFVNEPELYCQLGLYYQENKSFNEALIYFRKAANMATSTEKRVIMKHRCFK